SALAVAPQRPAHEQRAPAGDDPCEVGEAGRRPFVVAFEAHGAAHVCSGPPRAIKPESAGCSGSWGSSAAAVSNAACARGETCAGGGHIVPPSGGIRTRPCAERESTPATYTASLSTVWGSRPPQSGNRKSAQLSAQLF